MIGFHWKGQAKGCSKRQAQSQTYAKTCAKTPRAKNSSAARAAMILITALAASGANAALLLTEIYYNGPTPGSDPDEFLELSNSGDAAISLDGYAFTAGVDYVFSTDEWLEAGESLLLVANPAGFTTVFPDYSDALYDFSGALSNSGELLQLSANGDVLWSFSYDDGGGWPTSADGAGDSLQLLSGDLDFRDPTAWEGAAPTPGSWAGSTARRPVVQVAAPTTLMLLSGLLPWLALKRRA